MDIGMATLRVAFAVAAGAAAALPAEAAATASGSSYPCPTNPFLATLYWFDPVFTLDFVALTVFGAAVPICVAWFYIANMREEKLRRLRNDLSEQRWKINGAILSHRLGKQFSWQHYWKSVTSLVALVIIGAFGTFLLKPVMSADQCGLDYSRGANILLLGPYLGLLGEQAKSNGYFGHVLISITAFNFGFLGAYVYMLGQLMRRYATCDLTTTFFVSSTVRMAGSSVMALVASFLYAHPAVADAPGTDQALGWGWLANEVIASVAVISFMLGHFPDWGLMAIEKFAREKLGLARDNYAGLSLSKLPGMSYSHQMRLMEEGFDNAENLSTAKPLDLLLRTGFPYGQLKIWVSQSWLYSQMREHYGDFVCKTGLTSADEWHGFLNPPQHDESGKEARLAMLRSALGDAPFAAKAEVVGLLAERWVESRRWDLPPEPGA